MIEHTVRQDLLKIYRQALRSVNGSKVVADWLKGQHLPECSVIAIGKAAEAMLLGAADRLENRLLSALLITKRGHVAPDSWKDLPVKILESAHPVPDASSLAAGESLLSFLRELPEKRPLLFLISGGASSLVEVLAPGIDLASLQLLNTGLLSAGKSIHEMNRTRKQVSLIKGGGLCNFTGNRPVTALLISDVPGDDLSVIGSGMLYSPGPGGIRHHVVAGIDVALKAAAVEARRLGYAARIEKTLLTGSAEQQGRRFARDLLAAEQGVYLSGGETSVELPDTPGKGGRNQHLALAAAEVIRGSSNVWILAAGTDGTDGPTEDAGALVDGQTLLRAEQEAFSALDAMAAADAGSLLAASGDLIQTGPTGTNVMDLLIGFKADC